MPVYPVDLHRTADNRADGKKIRSTIRSVPCLIWGDGGGATIARVRRNLADRTLFPVVGDPVTAAGYTEFQSKKNYLQTPVSEPGQFTAFAFGRNADTSASNAKTGIFMGSFLGAADPGFLFYWSASNIIRAQVAQGTNTIRSVTLTITGPTQFKRYRVTVTNSAITLYNDTDSQSATQTVTATRDPGELPIYVGSSRSSIYGGLARMAHWSLFDGLPTSLETAAHWTQVQYLAASYGTEENAE